MSDGSIVSGKQLAQLTLEGFVVFLVDSLFQLYSYVLVVSCKVNKLTQELLHGF